MRRRRVAGVITVGCLLVLAAPTVAAARSTAIDVRLTDAGCPKRLETPAGRTTFRVENVDASAVSEFELLEGHRVLGERENLAPGLSASFTLDLEPGTYTTYCPGGDRERGKLVVTGPAGRPSSSSPRRAGKAETVKVTLNEFDIRVRPRSVAAGNVEFKVTNNGGLGHEFVVVRSDRATLPTAADGSIDESQVAAADMIGELEDLGPADSARLDAKLAAGTYTLFCNIVETTEDSTLNHYTRGMHIELRVR